MVSALTSAFRIFKFCHICWKLKLQFGTSNISSVLINQVLEGLLYLHHERHVIHRDIKPSNLLVNHKGEVKITDFGVSAVLASSIGQRDTFVGTYNYMAVCKKICFVF